MGRVTEKQYQKWCREVTESVEKMLDRLERTYDHDDDDGHDDDDTLEPTEIEITYTLQVNFTDVTPVIWAEIPVVRDNDGWRPTGYGAKLVGWWGNIGDSRGLPYTVAEALVKRYGELAK